MGLLYSSLTPCQGFHLHQGSIWKLLVVLSHHLDPACRYSVALSDADAVRTQALWTPSLTMQHGTGMLLPVLEAGSAAAFQARGKLQVHISICYKLLLLLAWSATAYIPL